MIPKRPEEIPFRRPSLSPRWRARTQFWTDEQWLQWRIKFLNRTFTRHKLLSQRELEARLSDFVAEGRPWIFPHDITALKQSGDIHEVENDPVPFYTRRNMPRMYYQPVLATKQQVYRGYLEICAQETCGSIGEVVVFRSMQAAQNVSIKPHELGNVTQINGNTTTGSLDTYGYLTSSSGTIARQSIPLGVEVKNGRHFVYPDSPDIWQTLRCAVELRCIPILITRRIHFKTALSCRSVGMIVFESQKQYFAEGLESDARLIQAYEELGFLDLLPWEKADPYIVRFFEGTVPKILDRTLKSFEANLDLIRTYAVDAELHDDGMHPEERSKRFSGFKSEFVRKTGNSKPW